MAGEESVVCPDKIWYDLNRKHDCQKGGPAVGRGISSAGIRKTVRRMEKILADESRTQDKEKNTNGLTCIIIAVMAFFLIIAAIIGAMFVMAVRERAKTAGAAEETVTEISCTYGPCNTHTLQNLPLQIPVGNAIVCLP